MTIYKKVPLTKKSMICLTVCVIMFIGCFVPVTASAACRNTGQHFKSYKNYSNSKITRTVTLTQNNVTTQYRYIKTNSGKWVCGYAKTADKDGVYLKKGNSVYWSPATKKVPTATLSLSPSYKDFSLGGLSLEIPLGKVSNESEITQEVGPAKKTGIYKVYVHRYYEIESMSKLARKYNRNTKKWGKWYVATKSCLATKESIISKPVLVYIKSGN